MGNFKARGALFIGIIFISLYPVLVKYMVGLTTISAFYRTFIPAICLLPFLICKPLKIPRGKFLFGTILCGILFGSDIYFWNQAIVGSSTTQATLLTNLAPIFVGILSFLFLPTKPKRNFWIGTFVAILGMIIFIGWQEFFSFSFNIYFLYGLISAFLYANYIVISKVVLEKVEIVPYMAINCLSSTVVLAIFNYYHGATFTGFSTKDWGLLIFGGLICQLLAWMLISYATKYMRATRVSLSLLSQTVFASALAYLLLNEVISLKMIIGGVIILIGIAITFIEKKID